MKINIGIADDHQLLLHSLAALIGNFGKFEVTLQAVNGKELLQRLTVMPQVPDIILVDVTMPVMDGPTTVKELTRDYPLIKTIALSMKHDDIVVISMLRAGCCAYLLKDIHPSELERALIQVHEKGYYNADFANINYRRLIVTSSDYKPAQLNERELAFLQLACSDLTYQQIADQMSLSERTIDGYRASIFEKFGVKSRVGMAMEAIRRKLVLP